LVQFVELPYSDGGLHIGEAKVYANRGMDKGATLYAPLVPKEQ
jgi:hypothetical protein